MQTLFLWLAASLSLITFAVHAFIGGAYVARPLLADCGLPKAPKWLNYYCWHIVTVLLLFMSGAFAYSALMPDRPELAVFSAALYWVLSALSVAVALKGRIHPLRFPSTSLFAVTGAVGFAGLALG